MEGNKKGITIAIDFDGTCVTHEYPNVGRDIGAAPVLRKLVENGHKLILWTMRDDKGQVPIIGTAETASAPQARKHMHSFILMMRR